MENPTSEEILVNRTLWENREYVRTGLRQPYMYVANALETTFAERLHDDLVRFTGWRDESHRKANYGDAVGRLHDFSYHRKQVAMNAADGPSSLRALYQFLNSPATLGWISDVSGRRCDAFGGSAAAYDIGDSLAVHNDNLTFRDKDGFVVSRTVTFNYFLTKQWNRDWGGRFIWCHPKREFVPEFNALLLFRVGIDTLHLVEPILAGAEQRRYSVTGWFVIRRSPAEMAKQDEV